LRAFHPAYAVLALFALSLGALAPARAQGEAPQGPWEIEAATLQYNQETGVYEAEGDVHGWRGAQEFWADRAAFNRRENTLEARGNVRLQMGEDYILADRVFLDMDTDTGTLQNGTIYVQQQNYYITGDLIEKTGKDTYRARGAGVTTCPGENPAWKLTGSHLSLRIEGYGWAKNVVLHAKGIPVAWLPAVGFPVKLKRSSGLLAPHMDQSDRKGFSFTQPYFWAISDNADATIYARAMEKRGILGAVQGRWVGSPDTRITAVAMGLSDDEQDLGTLQTQEWGYPGDPWDRPNSDRWWVVAKGDWESDGGVKVKADVDVVSDQDFLREFDDGPAGFFQVEDDFLDTFHRGLESETDVVRKNRLFVQKNWLLTAASGEFAYNDNVAARRWLNTDSTLSVLPFVGVSGVRRPVGETPLAFSWDTTYRHYFREDGLRGHRADFTGRANLPFSLVRGLHLDPGVAFLQTAWVVDSWENTPTPDDDRFFSRGMYELSADLSSGFLRDFSLDASWTNGLRHTFSPVLSWTFRPYGEESEAPAFDVVNRVESEHTLTLSLANGLWGRRGENLVPFRAAWLSLSQTYDIEEAAEDDPALFAAPGERRPWLPMDARLEVCPVSGFSLETGGDWSWYEDRFDEQWAALRFTHPVGHTACVEYRDVADTSETLHAQGALNLSDAWRVAGSVKHDFMADEVVESGVLVTYRAACWAVEASYEEDTYDRSWSLMIELTGLGSYGYARSLSP